MNSRLAPAQATPANSTPVFPADAPAAATIDPTSSARTTTQVSALSALVRWFVSATALSRRASGISPWLAFVAWRYSGIGRGGRALVQAKAIRARGPTRRR